MSRREKILLAVIDFILVLFAFFIAVVIRFEGEISSKYIYSFEWIFFATAFLVIFLFSLFGLYKKLWRYAGIQELKNIFIANIMAFLPSMLAAAVTGGHYYSRSIIVIALLLTFFFTGGIRLFLRILNENSSLRGGRRILIVGANDAGEAVLRTIIRQTKGGYMPVGFIDEDPQKTGIRIHNVPVLGTPADLSGITGSKNIEEIIIALPSPPLIRKVISQCENLRVQFKVVPALGEIIEGKRTVSQIRNIEIEDLLEREPVKLDMKPVKSFLEGKTILVTGAGGSIGSEICRQTTEHNIKKLILLGRGENSIYETALELKRKTEVPLVQFIADVKDEDRIRTLMEKYRPHIIFHAAAHKHVPLMEHNLIEALTNNVLGTRNLIRMAEEFGVESFTLLSTDKAVNPTSVMGASKRMAEMYMKSFSSGQHSCRYSAVRFGNVLGSRGSVVPTFRRQIAMGGPVTVTSADMTRYFMTIPEAVQLVIQAAAMGTDGGIFILDMGKPVKIMDLARNMIRLAGFEPERDIPIKILGMRPGEKMEEELVNTGEETRETQVEKIRMVVTDTIPLNEMEKQIEDLIGIARLGNDEVSKTAIAGIVRNYNRSIDT